MICPCICVNRSVLSSETLKEPLSPLPAFEEPLSPLPTLEEPLSSLPPLDFLWDRITFDKECQVNTIPLPMIPRAPTILEVLTSDEAISCNTGLSSIREFHQICEAVEYLLKSFTSTLIGN